MILKLNILLLGLIFSIFSIIFLENIGKEDLMKSLWSLQKNLISIMIIVELEFNLLAKI